MPRLEPRILHASKPGLNDAQLEIRNDATWTSAYIRGDRAVILHNHPGCLVEYAGNPGVVRKLGLAQDLSLSAEQEREYIDGVNPDRRLSDEDIPKVALYKGLETGFCGLKLHWKKLINEGGFGVVALYEAEFESGHRQDVVIKMPKGNARSDDMSQERLWHQSYEGSACIVQALDLNNIAESNAFLDRFWRGEEFNEEEENVLVLEHMPHGNLRGAFQKASYLNIPFPNNALWQLWESLVVGIAEVAYQNEFREVLDLNFAEAFAKEIRKGPEALEAFFEYLREDMTNSHDVHFDLEESNILLKKCDDGGVRFKLHDFGSVWSKGMQRAWGYWSPRKYWSFRKSPKTGKHLPEQHVKEWDSLPFPDKENNGRRFEGDDLGSKPSKTKTAGRYGSWTNVYIIARTMQSAITLCYYHHPFRAQKGHPDDEMASYGWRMNEERFPGVDPDLMEIIRRCMREAPVDRDDIEQLLRDIIDARAAGKMDVNDESNRFWDSILQPWPEVVAQADREIQEHARDDPGPGGPQGGAGNAPGPANPQGGAGVAQRPVVAQIVRGNAGNGGGRVTRGQVMHAKTQPAARTPLRPLQPLALRPKKRELKPAEAVKREETKKLHARVHQYAGRMGEHMPVGLQNLNLESRKEDVRPLDVVSEIF